MEKKDIALDNMEGIIGKAKIGGNARIVRPVGKYKKGQKVELFNEKNRPNKYTLKLLENGNAVIMSGDWIWDDVENRLMPKENSIWINVDARRTLLLKKWDKKLDSKLQRVKVNRWYYKPEWTTAKIKDDIRDAVESQMEDEYDDWTDGKTGIFPYSPSPYNLDETEIGDIQIEAQRLGSEYEPLTSLKMYNVSFIDTKEKVYETDTTNKCVYNALRKRFGNDKGFLGKLVKCERTLFLYLNSHMDKKYCKRVYKRKDTEIDGLSYDPNESDFGVDTNQLIKLCKDFNKKLVAINMDENVIASHYPDKPDRNGARSLFYRIKHNHLYLMTDGADMRRYGYKATQNNKKLSGTEKAQKIKDKIKVPEDFCEQANYKEIKYYSVDEFNGKKLDPKYNHMIITEDLKDIFYAEYKRGILLSEDLVCNSDGDIVRLKMGENSIYACCESMDDRLENIRKANKYIAQNFTGDKKDINFIAWETALFNEGCILEQFFYKLYGTDKKALSSRLTTDFWDLLKDYEQRPRVWREGYNLVSNVKRDEYDKTPYKMADAETLKKRGFVRVPTRCLDRTIKRSKSKLSFTDIEGNDKSEAKKDYTPEIIEEITIPENVKAYEIIRDDKYEYWDIRKAYYTAMTKVNTQDFMIFDELCRIQEGGTRHFLASKNYLYLVEGLTDEGFHTLQTLQYYANGGNKFNIIGFIRPIKYMPKDTFTTIFKWILENFIEPKNYINQFIGTLSKRYNKRTKALFTTDKTQIFSTMWDERNSSRKYIPKLVSKNGETIKTKPLYALYEYNYWELRYSQHLMRIQIVGLCNLMVQQLLECAGYCVEMITDCVVCPVGMMDAKKLAELPFFVDKKEGFNPKRSITLTQYDIESNYNKHFGGCPQYTPFKFDDSINNFKKKYLTPIYWKQFDEGKDFTDIIPMLDNEKRGMITGDAGRGKTYNAKRLIAERLKMGIKIQPLSFTNKATNNLNGLTIHKFFGLSVEAKNSIDMETQVVNMIDDLGIGGFVIDEISMTPRICWSILVQLSIKRPDLEFWGFGDWEQLPPVEDYTEKYYHHPQIKELFGRKEYRLIINRRSGEDAEAIEKAVSEIKNGKLDITQFKPTKEITEYPRHLAYYKDKCREINRLIMAVKKTESSVRVKTPNMDFNDELWLYHKLPLISVKNVKDDGISKNEDFYLDRVENTTIFVKRPDYEGGEEIVYEYELDIFVKTFCASYCITIHRSQGDTIKGEFLIHNWKKIEELKEFGYMNDDTIKKVRYVAFTRTTGIDKVKILPF
tara:strand:+ start:4673 stop:8491 length:3819 start_codon:yes stop_codon:yes gene_type:complete